MLLGQAIAPKVQTYSTNAEVSSYEHTPLV